MVKRVVTSVEVADVEKRRLPSKHYVYVVKVTWSDGSTTVVFRRYSRFFEFQVRLLEAFPEEAGEHDPTQRMIPFLPGKIFFGRSHIREVAVKRMKPIDQYCKTLIRLPPAISESHLVLQFFQVEEEDLNPIRDEKDRKRGKSVSEHHRFGRPTAHPVGDVISEPMLLEQFVAIADYKKQKKNEVSLVAGLSVEVVEKTENGWWFVRVEEDQGWVPASYLEPADGGISTSREVKRAKQGEEEQFVTTDSYTAANVDELSFEKGVVVDVVEKNMEGWWLVRYNGREGVVPAAYLQYMTARPNELGSGSTGGVEVVATVNDAVSGKLEQQATETEKKADRRKVQNELPTRRGSSQSGLAPRRQSIKVTNKMRSQLNAGISKQPSLPEGGVLPGRAGLAMSKSKEIPAVDASASISSGSNTAVVLVTYRAVGSTEISLDEGESVVVLERNDTGWWYVEVRGRRGWVPSSSFLNNATTPPSSPEMNRSRSDSGSGEQADSCQYVTMADFSAAADDGLSFKGGQNVKVLEKAANGWWYCAIDGQEGWAPSSYIEEKPGSNTVTGKPGGKPDLVGDLAKVSLRTTVKQDVKTEGKPSSGSSVSGGLDLGKVALKPVKAGGDESKESGSKGVPGGGKAALKPFNKKAGEESGKTALKPLGKKATDDAGSTFVKPELKLVTPAKTDDPVQPVKKSMPVPSDLARSESDDTNNRRNMSVVLPDVGKAALKPVVKKPSDDGGGAAAKPAPKPVSQAKTNTPVPENKSEPNDDEVASGAERSSSVAAQIAKLRAVPPASASSSSGSNSGPTAAVRKPLRPPSGPHKSEPTKEERTGNSADGGSSGKRLSTLPSKGDGPTPSARSGLKPTVVPHVNSRPIVQKAESALPVASSRERSPSSGKKLGKIKAPPGLSAMFGGGAERPQSTSPSKSPPASNGEEYVVVADYEKEDDSGITLKKGQRITVDEKNPNGWWFVICGGAEGWAPSTFLEKAGNAAQAPARPSKGPESQPKKPGVVKSLPVKSSSTTNEDSYVVSASYTAKGSDEISLKEGTTVSVLEKADSGWWFVKDGSKEGWAPSTYLTQKSSKAPAPGARKPAPAPASNAKKPPKLPGRPAAGPKKYIAVANYSGEEGEVSLTQGQTVEVLEKADTGWWFIKAGGTEGWAPSTYIEMA